MHLRIMVAPLSPQPEGSCAALGLSGIISSVETSDIGQLKCLPAEVLYGTTVHQPACRSATLFPYTLYFGADVTQLF